MAGGEIIVRPKPSETYAWNDNCIAGNTCLYGATGGALFAAGSAAPTKPQNPKAIKFLIYLSRRNSLYLYKFSAITKEMSKSFI